MVYQGSILTQKELSKIEERAYEVYPDVFENGIRRTSIGMHYLRDGYMKGYIEAVENERTSLKNTFKRNGTWFSIGLVIGFSLLGLFILPVIA